MHSMFIICKFVFGYVSFDLWGMRDPIVHLFLDWTIGYCWGINYFMCHELDNSSFTWTVFVTSHANKR